VLAATASGIGEYAQSQVQELATPPAPPRLDTAAMRRDATLPGHPVLSSTTTARQAYRYLLGNLRAGGRAIVGNGLWTYWQAGPVRYRRASDGDLVPGTVRNPVSVWGTGNSLFYAPLDNAGTQYRTLRQHAVTAQDTISPVPQLTGAFDESRIAAFDPLARVPLGPYQPTVAAAASAASRKALGGGDLLPSMNLGGYVSQPVQLITTLAALPTVESRKYTGDTQLRHAPISVIRVRVTPALRYPGGGARNPLVIWRNVTPTASRVAFGSAELAMSRPARVIAPNSSRTSVGGSATWSSPAALAASIACTAASSA
jgi:hypothetical protein